MTKIILTKNSTFIEKIEIKEVVENAIFYCDVYMKNRAYRYVVDDSRIYINEFEMALEKSAGKAYNQFLKKNFKGEKIL